MGKVIDALIYLAHAPFIILLIVLFVGAVATDIYERYYR